MVTSRGQEVDLVELTPVAGSYESPKSRSTVNQAEHLVQELADLKVQMKNVLKDAVPWKSGDVHYQPSVPTGQMLPLDEPAPLDAYLVKPDKMVPTSPYPKLRDPALGNAPVVANFTDVEKVLQEARKSQQYLEANLGAILRSKQDGDVYRFIDDLTRDSSAAEQLKIRDMVDNCISSMNKELEKEIFEEMLKIDAAKKNVMIPERDTSAKVKVMSKPGSKGRPRVEARVNTGLRRVKKEETLKSKVPTREGFPKVKASEKKRKPLSKPAGAPSEADLSRVYGKSLYQAQRISQKEPYLRYQSTSPKAKLQRPPPAGHVKGVTVPPAQPKSKGPHDHYYFDPVTQQQGKLMGPVPGQLIPMAIPLEPPKQGQSPFLPVPMSAGPITSTPLTQPKTALDANVQLLTLEAEEDERRLAHERALEIQRKKPKLTTQVLPAIDIDTIPSSTPRDVGLAVGTQVPSVDRVDVTPSQVEDEESEDDDDEGIDLPGYQAPYQKEYHGPAFPPQGAALPANDGLSSDILAEDLRRRDLLQNKAMDWIEQELMARMISEITAQHAKMVPPQAQPSTRNKPRHTVEGDSELSEVSEVSDVSGHESLLAEVVGQDGLQLFVDAGLPVDERIVSSLIKEVLMEKVGSMAGQRTAEDEEAVPVRPPPQPRPRSPVKSRISPQLVSPPRELRSPVPTPEPTPEHTPRTSVVTSPVRHYASPPRTPELTPEQSAAEEPSVAVQSEEESSAAELPPVNKFEDALREGMKSSRPQPEDFRQRHEVHTPETTPPPTPLQVYTPEPSLQESLPAAPVEEVHPPSPEVESTPPVSPKPLEDLHSTLQEENIDLDKDDSLDAEAILSAAQEPEKVEAATSPIPRESTPTPAEPETQQTSTISTTAASPETSITETVNECVSEGQWLISVHSEGEVGATDPVAPFFAGPAAKIMIGQRFTQPDDTLLDTEELEPDQDDSTDVSQSEGEFIHRSNIPPERDPRLLFLAQAQQPFKLIEQQLAASRQAVVQSVGDKSLGEISVGQGLSVPLDVQDLLVDQDVTASMGQIVHVAMQPSHSSKIAKQPNRAEEGEAGLGASGSSVRDSPMRMSDLHAGGRSPGGPGRIMATGSPIKSAGRMSGRQALPGGGRSRVIQVLERSSSPEEVDATASRENHLRDTMESLEGAGFHGTRTSSDFETGAMTPDQLDVAALMQSRDYLTQTFSQSEPGSTTDFHQSGTLRTGEFTQSGRFTNTLRRSGELGQSGLQTQTRYEDLKMTATSQYTSSVGSARGSEQVRQSMDRSGTIGHMGQTYSTVGSATASELQFSGGYADSLEGTGFGQMTTGSELDETGSSGYFNLQTRTGPLQVSVTIPSIDQAQSGSEESIEDVSEISMQGNK